MTINPVTPLLGVKVEIEVPLELVELAVVPVFIP